MHKVFSNSIAKFSWHPGALLVIVPLSFAALCNLLNFNGLYGQDAHEYLRQSCGFHEKMLGLGYIPEGKGDSEFAAGFPFAAALLRFLIPDAMLALQLVSLLSAGMAAYFFAKMLGLLHLGTRAWIRLLFVALLLVCAPVFVRAGITSMSDAMGLAAMLAAFFYGFRFLENGKTNNAAWSGFATVLAVTTRFSVAVLLLPLAVMVGLRLIKNRNWKGICLSLVATGVASFPHFWAKTGISKGPLGHSLLADFSLANLFSNHFSTVSGTVEYPFPNFIYLLFPIGHPVFFMLLPLLFFFFKKTDLALPEKRILLISTGLHLFFLGCLAHQNHRYLLPDYALLLLIFFPAWHRAMVDGVYLKSNKKLVVAAVAIGLLTQIWGIQKTLSPTIWRNRLEHQLVENVRDALPSGSVLFSFDVDIALRSYLPKEIEIRNMWLKKYDDAPSGSFLLFNEPALRAQWTGKNPMLNFDFFEKKYGLQTVKDLPGGWKLYTVGH